LKIDFLGVKHLYLYFPAISSHWNLGGVDDALAIKFFSNIQGHSTLKKRLIRPMTMG